MDPGTRIADRFEVLDFANAGGMGAVYRARDLRTGTPVALKVLLPTRDPDAEARFAREARVLAGLRHPAVLRYLDHGLLPDGRPYLITAWLEGEDLSQRLAREGALGVSETLVLLRRIAGALGAAHARGIVHRDIKPANVFLPGTLAARATVLDFGLASWRTGGVSLTAPGGLLGTPGYMAPEQARGEVVDARADVFALGALAYRCLAGREAFAGNDVLPVLLKVVFDEPPPLGRQRAGLPAALEALVARMLAKDPGARPRHGAAVREALAASRLGRVTARSGKAPAALGTDELRWRCAVFARPRPVEIATAETLRPDRPDPRRSAIEHAAARHDGRALWLADGSLVLTVSTAGAATDQAARAARCAQSLRTILGDAPVVVVGARVDGDDVASLGTVIERGAALLAARAAGSGVCVDETVAGLLDASFVLRDEVAGFSLGGEMATLDGVRTLLGRALPCVGREHELARLDAALHECREESVARVWLVTGAAGTGKSRVRQEFAHAARKRGGARVCVTRADPLRAASPFAVAASLLEDAAEVPLSAATAVRARRLREWVARWLPAHDAARVTEFLAELLGLPAGGAPSERVRAARRDPVLMGDQMQRAWTDAMGALVREQPLVLAVDDAQWADAPSLLWLDRTLREHAEQALLVLALARPEVDTVHPALFEARGVQRLRLLDLPRRASERLVRAALGARADDALVNALVERGAGNPFYLEELVRASAEGASATAMPSTVLAMAQSRLEAVPPAGRRVLRAASVFGQVFWREGVDALLGGDARGDDAPAVWLATLVEREIVVARTMGRFADAQEFAFRHVLLRDAAYATLTEADRAMGHRLAGAWLERAGERDPLVLAGHFERAGDLDEAMRARAAECYRRAALAALEAADLSAVGAHATRGLTLASGATLGALWWLRSEARLGLGHAPDAERDGRAALDALPRGSDPWFQSLANAAVAAAIQGGYDRLAPLAELARTPAPHDDEAARASRAFALARISQHARYGGASTLAAELLAELEREGAAHGPDSPEAVGARDAQNYAAVFAGDLGRTLLLARQVAADVERRDDWRALVGAQANVGYACLALGAYDEAERVLRDAMATATRLGIQGGYHGARQCLGVALGRIGRLREAREHLEAAHRFYRARGNVRLTGGTLAYLAELALLEQRSDEATARARESILLLHGRRALQIPALAVLAGALLARGRAGRARRVAHAAWSYFARGGAAEQGEAAVRLVYAEALAAAGERDASDAVLRDARARLLARAHGIPDAEHRQSYLAIREHARTIELADAADRGDARHWR